MLEIIDDVHISEMSVFPDKSDHLGMPGTHYDQTNCRAHGLPASQYVFFIACQVLNQICFEVFAFPSRPHKFQDHPLLCMRRVKIWIKAPAWLLLSCCLVLLRSTSAICHTESLSTTSTTSFHHFCPLTTTTPMTNHRHQPISNHP